MAGQQVRERRRGVTGSQTREWDGLIAQGDIFVGFIGGEASARKGFSTREKGVLLGGGSYLRLRLRLRKWLWRVILLRGEASFLCLVESLA